MKTIRVLAITALMTVVALLHVVYVLSVVIKEMLSKRKGNGCLRTDKKLCREAASGWNAGHFESGGLNEADAS